LNFIYILAEVPGAARVNLQPAEHLKNLGFQAPQAQGGGGEVKPAHQDRCRGLDFH